MTTPTSTPSITLGMVVLDTPDPRGLARFYADLLGWALDPEDTSDDWVTIRGGEGTTAVAFQLAPDLPVVTWPTGAVPQQSHLDLHVPAYEPHQTRALELGATLVAAPEDHPTFRVYTDPSGHPFCLCLV